MSKYPDEGTFPNSGGEVLDRAGIKDTGYLEKKGTPMGQSVTPTSVSGHIFNQMPPGDNIGDQSVADIKRTDSMKVKKVVDMGYPGDGWT